VCAGSYSEIVRAVAIIDSPATYPASAKQALKEMAERRPRRFDSLEEAVAAFRTVPNDTAAAPEIMRHVAINSFRLESDGKWVHKIDRRTMLRDPIDAWPLLARIQCPALYVRPASTPMPRDYGQQIAARMPRGRFAIVLDSHHHVLLDNPQGLIVALQEFFNDL
jgi:pimeloyl-ACP methyl ester carboxylesterase